MKNYIKKLVHKVGLNLNAASSSSSIKSLITQLHPFKTNFDLIRLGPNNDSGYLLPNDLEGIEACFSPGCDNKFSFEENCFNRGMKIFIADKTVSENNVPNKFNFTKKFVSSISNKDFMTIDNWVSSSLPNNNSDLLLQMDIEGDEYQCILNMSDDLLNRFRIIIIEFHDLDKLFNNFFYDIASTVFRKLLQNHTCVHIHPNNIREIINIDGISIPPLAEFTFIRNDRIKSKKPQRVFPHLLDQDCVPNKKTQVLPNIWFK